ncbi:MAG: glycine betaine ABC transporter substrate-binding protein [Rhodospirillales bacterium]|nr:MAG: glycine betaine ABC transporter substrate-binding protein [Rhodospirillales bacterium]
MVKLSRPVEIALWVAAFVAMVLVGRYVLSPEQERVEDRQVVRLGYVSWAEGIAMTHMVRVLLEDRFGFDVDLTLADPAPIFVSLANQDVDLFLHAWLPKTHSSHMEEYGDQLTDLGANYEGARIGLVVPAYVDIDTVAELRENTGRFNGAITGIDSGAGIMEATRRAIEVYDLDMTLLTSSGAAMTASLRDAIQAERPIVVTGWRPHWMFARWDLKFLDDPEQVYGEAESIHTLARRGLATDMPEVVEFLRSMTLTDQQIGSLMDRMRQTADQREAASAWISEHPELVESWF